MPEMLCVFWKLVMFAAVGAFDFLAKKAVSALAYAVSPAIVLVVVHRITDRADRVEEGLELPEDVLGRDLARWAGVPVHTWLDVERVGLPAVGDAPVGDARHLGRHVRGGRGVLNPARIGGAGIRHGRVIQELPGVGMRELVVRRVIRGHGVEVGGAGGGDDVQRPAGHRCLTTSCCRSPARMSTTNYTRPGRQRPVPPPPAQRSAWAY